MNKLEEAAKVRVRDRLPAHDGRAAAFEPDAEGRAPQNPQGSAAADHETLARSNVRLGLEFLGPLHFRTRNPHEFIWRMDEALAFAKECGPNIGLTLDAWHWHHAGATAADILAAGKAPHRPRARVGRTSSNRLKRFATTSGSCPGEGVIDLTTFFRRCRRSGYEDAVSPEPIGRVPQEMQRRGGSAAGPRDDAGGHAKGEGHLTLKKGQLSVPFPFVRLSAL